MDPQTNLKQLQDLFTQAKDILIITREKPSIDGLCACLALKNALSQKMDMAGKKKKVTLAVSKRNGTQYSLLPGTDQIVSELGLRDLVIGVNGFVEGSLENVNWYIDKGRLNVVFKSNPAIPMQFDLKNLDPFYAGANFDVVIVVDANTPQDLGNAYKQDPGMYTELPVINVSNSPENTRFGRINIVDPNIASVSELAFQLAQIAQLNVMGDVATLFLTGIVAGTDNLARKDAQTDTIVNQLQSFGGKQLDIQGIQNQESLPLLPVHKNPPPAPTVPNPAPTQMLPGVPPYAQQMPPMPYGQYPNQPYPPYMQPPQGQYPQYPVPPMGYYPNPYQMPPQGYPPQYAPMPPQQYAPEPAPIEENTQPDTQVTNDWEQENPDTMPSIEHDQTQTDTYIPTVEPTSFAHVEPSIYMPGLPQQPDVYQQPEYQWPAQDDQQYQPNQQDMPLEEHKEQQQAPDFNAPPPGFTPGEKKY